MNELFGRYNNLYTDEERKKLIAMGLKAYRTAAGMTQKETAEALGLKVTTYVAYERGQNEPTAETLVRLSLLYDISLDILMQRDNMAKSKLATTMQLDDAQAEIKELKKKLESMDDENDKEIVSQLLDNFEAFAKALGDLANGITDVVKKDNEEEI